MVPFRSAFQPVVGPSARDALDPRGPSTRDALDPRGPSARDALDPRGPSTRVPRRLLAVALLALAAAGCDILLPEMPEDNEILDAPLDGLGSTQLAVHLAGDEEFGRRFSPAEGVGPLFNAPSCDQCHIGEGKGHLLFNLTRFGRMTESGFDPMRSAGGPQLQNRAVPAFAPESVPPGVTGSADFMPPSVTGLGFLEAVDDTTLLRLQDPDDEDGDGISGRVQIVTGSTVVSEVADLEAIAQDGPPTRGMRVEGGFIGRFGRKASSINLLQQTVTAFHQDMGLTTDIFTRDLFAAETGNFAEDDVPDPEITSDVVNALVFYLKTLRQPLRRDADDPEVQAGEQIFAEIGCDGCHLPTLRTGESEIAALSRVTFHPYTDLLLHDMGPELDDGYTEGRAATYEWRTTPLWGLGLSAAFQGGQAFFMHDGRARSLEEAILWHGGEAQAAREAYSSMAESERDALIAFVKSL